jgi:ankyrin repeat protein
MSADWLADDPLARPFTMQEIEALSAVDRNDEQALLTRVSANPSLVTRYHLGRTLLHVAAHDGFQHLVFMLLKFGADPNAQDVNGRTPLFDAVSKGRAGVVRILLERGADPNIVSGDGRSIRGALPLREMISDQDWDEIDNMFSCRCCATNKAARV